MRSQSHHYITVTSREQRESFPIKKIKSHYVSFCISRKRWDNLPSRWVTNKKGQYDGCSYTLTVHFRGQRPIRCSPSHAILFQTSPSQKMWLFTSQGTTFNDSFDKENYFKNIWDLFPFPSARTFFFYPTMSQSHFKSQLINVARSGFHQTHLIPLCSASFSECFQLNFNSTTNTERPHLLEARKCI